MKLDQMKIRYIIIETQNEKGEVKFMNFKHLKKAGWILTVVSVVLFSAVPVWGQRGGRGGGTRQEQLYVSKDHADHPQSNYERAMEQKAEIDKQFEEACAGIIDYKKIKYRSRIGDLDIPAYLFQPLEKRGRRGHAAMVWVHGGVHGNWGFSMFRFVREAVEYGYVIICPEYRGSTGYGQEFHNEIDYGGYEVDDCLTGYDYLVENLPHVDPERIGMMGWSHGGFITCHSLFRENQTEFKCGAAIVPVTNLIFRLSYKGPGYQRNFSTQKRLQGLPFENREEYVKRSPIYHVDKLQVPLLCHVATNDADVNFVECEAMINALRAKKPLLSETKVYVDPPFGHSFSRRGDSRELLDSWARTWTFFEWNLQPNLDKSKPAVEAEPARETFAVRRGIAAGGRGVAAVGRGVAAVGRGVAAAGRGVAAAGRGISERGVSAGAVSARAVRARVIAEMDPVEKVHEEFVFADMHAHPDRFHRANIEAIGREELDRYRRGLMDVVVCNISSDAAYQGGYTNRDGSSVRRLGAGEDYTLERGKAFEFTLDRFEKILRTIEDNEDVVLASDPRSVMRAKRQGQIALIPALEGADGLEGSVGNLRLLHQRGLRLLQLVHFRANELGYIQTEPYQAGGLTEIGEEMVKECNRLGIIIDLAHAHKQTSLDAVRVSEDPVIFSHTGAKALYEGDRYLSDEEIKAIASKGGIIGIWPSSSFKDMKEMVRHIDHVKNLVGIDHVGIGSDLRGMSYVPEFGEEADFRAIAEALLDSGYSEEDVGKVMGGNFFRLWRLISR
jgi:microsomal dipeptidase-like Zn-dependent dipeptidase/dienelactone hydrolase